MMSAIRPADLKVIKSNRNQRWLVCRVDVAFGAMSELRENIDLSTIRVRGADFDGDIF